MTDEFVNMIEDRDAAADAGDLAATLKLDDELEDYGMPADDRITCWTCQDWAEEGHWHDPLNGVLLSR